MTTEAGEDPPTRALSGPFHLPGPAGLLWRHKHLFRRLLVRDIEQTFRGSVLGLAWIVVIPLVMVAAYTFVFVRVLGTTWPRPTATPYDVPLIYFAGLTTFGFFMEVVMRAPNCLRDNETYVTKVIFPLDILPFVLAGTALFRAAINLTLVLVFMLVVHGGLPAGVLLLPVIFLPFAAMAVGFGWILAAVGVFVRDLNHALQALAPVIIFVSPVFYSADQVPAAIRPFYALNPMTFVLESVRDALFFGGGIRPGGYLAYCAAAALIFSVGYLFFNRLRPGFADVI